jgi:tyrosine-protein kinase
VLAKVTDTTLLVVRANSTRMDKLDRALQALRTVDAKLAGAVLNMVPAKGPDIDYYGYYGKGQGAKALPKEPVDASLMVGRPGS